MINYFNSLHCVAVAAADMADNREFVIMSIISKFKQLLIYLLAYHDMIIETLSLSVVRRLQTVWSSPNLTVYPLQTVCHGNRQI